MKFIHLHVHSHYSLLDGLAKIDELIAKAKEYDMPAIALTDHGVMYGAIEFYTKAKAAGIKPIIGIEAYLARQSRFDKNPHFNEKPFHLVLLAKNYQGYQNLIKLTTKAHLEGFYYKPRIDWELLRDYSQGLIALSACPQGEIPQAILEKKLEKAEELIHKYQETFGKENFYLEVQDHPHNKDQVLINKALFSLSKKLSVPLVATNDVHYLNPEDDEAQDVLLCLQTKKKKEDKDRMSMLGDDFSFRSPDSMINAFKEHPEAIANTEKIAESCNLEIELEKIKLPHFPLPNGQTPDEYLRKLTFENLKKKYKKTKDAEAQLKYELEVIKQTGYASYFLIVQDFVNWAKEREIIVGPGRGSAAGSIVSYLLNITNVDPLKYGLIFERFLNPERVTMPDIDLDFADNRRNEVIDYVAEKYGHDHVSQIITFGTMAARAAVRDVGRVLNFPYGFCDKIAKLIPMLSTLENALNSVPELKELYQQDEGARKIIDMAKKLEGVNRHASTHACGVLITPEPLDHYVPLQRASSSDKTIISQYDMKSVEKIGLLKMDFLGLKNLTLLQEAIKKIKITKNIDIDIEKIPLDDKKTFKLLQNGRTTGVFQLESSGMKRYLKQLKPTCFEDIIAMVALYRPGPMEFIPQYIAGKQKKIKIKYLHPKLKPILSKTYGIAVYQEQILQIARDLAGFSLGEADILRRAIGKKIGKLLKEQKKKFINGCIKNGIKKETAEKIFTFIEPFAGYGFNKAHATCYAMIAYQTAYLKANYPTEFMAALLISDQQDTERITIEVEECKQMGIEVLPPDINESFEDFTVVKGAKKPTIRFGLLAIKNVGSHIAEVIIKEREANGPFKSLADFLRRIQDKDLNKKSLESLIKSGSLDNLGERNQMLENIDQLLQFARLSKKEKENGQKSLFASQAPINTTLKLKPANPAPIEQKLSWEKKLLGIYISRHPMDDFLPYIKEFITPCAHLSLNNQRRVKIAGVITKVQRVLTRSNEIMLFVKIEDSSGSIETLIFPSLYKQNPSLWQEDKILIVNGRLSDKDGTIKLIAEDYSELTLDNIKKIRKEISSLEKKEIKEERIEKPISEIKLMLSQEILKDTAKIEAIKEVIKKYPGNLPLYLIIKDKDDKLKKVKTNYLIKADPEFKEEIEKIIGPHSFI